MAYSIRYNSQTEKEKAIKLLMDNGYLPNNTIPHLVERSIGYLVILITLGYYYECEFTRINNYGITPIDFDVLKAKLESLK